MMSAGNEVAFCMISAGNVSRFCWSIQVSIHMCIYQS